MAEYYIIPVIQGNPDIDWETDSFRVMHYIDKQINDNGDVKQIMYGELNCGTVRDSWENITEDEFYKIVPKEDIIPQIDPIEELKEKIIGQESVQAEHLSLQADILLNQQNIQENQAMILSNQADIMLGGVNSV